MWENAALPVRRLGGWLPQDDFKRVNHLATHDKRPQWQGHLLVIGRLLGWMLAGANDDRARILVQVLPTDANDLAQAHRGRDREQGEVNHWNGLPRVCGPMIDQTSKLRVRRAPIALLGIGEAARVAQRAPGRVNSGERSGRRLLCP